MSPSQELENVLKNIVAAMTAAAGATAIGAVLYSVATGADCIPSSSLEAGACVMYLEE